MANNISMEAIKKMYDCSKLSKDEIKRLHEGVCKAENCADIEAIESEIFHKEEKKDAND